MTQDEYAEMLSQAKEQFKQGTPLFGKDGAFHRVLEDFLNSALDEGVSKLIHPLFVLPLPCLRHNSLFTAAMLLISYKMIYWALNSLYKLV